MSNFTLQIIKGEFTIHKLNSNSKIPASVFESGYFWISRTDDELSITCDSKIILKSIRQEPGWNSLKIIGPIPFTETGVISRLTGILAEHKIGVFVISTFDTDYILVKKEQLQDSIEALKKSAYLFIE